jgi:phage regulator Rha-like protein
MENVAIIKFNNVEDHIISLRNEKVILDSNVATLYGVETKRVNEAVKNNADKFPDGYIMELTDNEHEALRSKISTLKKSERGQHVKYMPKAFTEKGLYMLATILKSPRATQTTIAIVETFAKIRELSRTMAELAEASEEVRKKSLMQRSGEIIANMLGEEMKTTDTETSIEFNLALLKVRHTIKQKSKE